MMHKRCTCCGLEKPIEQFANGGWYVNRKGQKIAYKRKTCKLCYSGANRLYENKKRERERDNFNRLVGWPAIALAIIFGIYSHDYLSGRNRICVYESVYGDFAVTIDAMKMCPLTWEYEDD